MHNLPFLGDMSFLFKWRFYSSNLDTPSSSYPTFKIKYTSDHYLSAENNKNYFGAKPVGSVR